MHSGLILSMGGKGSQEVVEKIIVKYNYTTATMEFVTTCKKPEGSGVTPSLTKHHTPRFISHDCFFALNSGSTFY